jgi:hypothetical protein
MGRFFSQVVKEDCGRRPAPRWDDREMACLDGMIGRWGINTILGVGHNFKHVVRVLSCWTQGLLITGTYLLRKLMVVI